MKELDKGELRAEAEKRLKGRPLTHGSAEDNVKLLAELTIHQEELNIQNEELRRIQLELEATKAKYFELYDLAPVGYIMLSPDLIIKEVNLAAAKLLDVDRNMLINRGLSNFVPSEHHESLYLHYKRLAQGHPELDQAFSIRKKNGSFVRVQFESNLIQNGQVTGFRSILTDVTRLKKAEEALHRANGQLEDKVRERTRELATSESKYRGLFESMQETISVFRLVYDSHRSIVDLELVDANPSALKLLGVPSIEKLIRRRNSEVLNEEMAAIALEDAKKTHATKRPVVETIPFEVKGRSYLTTFAPLGKDTVIATGFDVTEIRLAQKEMEQCTKNLRRSNQELQMFEHLASHDLQEPLRMVISYLTLLEKRYPDGLDPEAHEYINFAVNGGKRMKELIDDLLEYSRIDMMDKDLDQVDMASVTGEALELLRDRISESGAEIVIGPLPTISAERSQMVQVMQNLIGNAIKFHGRERPTIQISAARGFDEWIFSIKDNGIGLDMEYKDKIFQMFQHLQTNDQYPGSGVGLAIVKKIVERHGGRIWVESEEGKGTAFFFTIPEKGEIRQTSLKQK